MYFIILIILLLIVYVLLGVILCTLIDIDYDLWYFYNEQVKIMGKLKWWLTWPYQIIKWYRI